MKSILRKLRASAGETLTETLVAMLVISCGSVLLATMLSTAIRLSTDARVHDETLYSELTSAELTKNGSFASAYQKVGKLEVAEGAHVWSVDISIYGN